jgi:hypothetical protein
MIVALVSSLSRFPQHQVNQYIRNSELKALNIFKIPKERRSKVKKAQTMMVNKSTNISKMNNYYVIQE